MPVTGLSVLHSLADAYAGGDDLTFREVMRRCLTNGTPEEVADLIDADGRYRIARNLEVGLDRYLQAIPDLAEQALPLDSAIDMAFRALARTSRVDETQVQQLVRRHPSFATPIREAAVLNQAVWTTTQVHGQLEAPPRRSLPSVFGPAIPGDGSPRYELTQLLGEGGFGQVYLAVDRQLSEKDHQALVSIKILTGQRRSARARDRLTDEATKARRVNHGNVVRIIDRGISGNDEDFIVYEFVDGGDLFRWARNHGGAQSARTAARLVTRIARGVHAAHMAGLVHCDLKPANIVMTSEGEPKVADFGIAIRPDDRESDAAAAHGPATPVGNLAFMSPEQYHLEPGALTIPTDVYALGGILFWLLTGELPNGRTPEQVRQVHDRTSGRRGPPDLSQHRQDVDQDLAAICAKAMGHDPVDRYSSAAAMADDLDAWLNLEPIEWTSPSLWRRTSLWVRRKPTAAVAAAVILLVVAGSAVALNRMAAEMRQRDFDAAMAQAKIEAEAAATAERLKNEATARSKFRDILVKINERFKVALAESGFSTELLAYVWLAEWLFSPTILTDKPDAMDFWNGRIDVIRHVIQRAQATGEGGSIHTLLWESALAFWLVNRGQDGDYQEAEVLLDASLEKWNGLLTRDDPWLINVRAIRASAFIRRIALLAAPERNPADLARLADEEELILQTSRQVSDLSEGDPMRVHLAATLKVLYGPQLLNQPDRVPPDKTPAGDDKPTGQATSAKSSSVP